MSAADIFGGIVDGGTRSAALLNAMDRATDSRDSAVIYALHLLAAPSALKTADTADSGARTLQSPWEALSELVSVLLWVGRDAGGLLDERLLDSDAWVMNRVDTLLRRVDRSAAVAADALARVWPVAHVARSGETPHSFVDELAGFVANARGWAAALRSELRESSSQLVLCCDELPPLLRRLALADRALAGCGARPAGDPSGTPPPQTLHKIVVVLSSGLQQFAARWVTSLRDDPFVWDGVGLIAQCRALEEAAQVLDCCETEYSIV